MRILPFGESALLLEFSSSSQVAAWHAELSRRRDAGELAVTDLVPAARTLLLDGLDRPADLATALNTWPPPPPAAERSARLVEVPTVYDGPDLADVAVLWGVDVSEVIARHTAIEFQVAFCGFSPGFGYLTGLPGHLAVPRLSRPRPAVSAGSVGLAGPYSGIYPSESPGGWRLIGRTELRLFDPDRDPPALFQPGARVRFLPR
ncbi:MAG TPA: allophanate hydrolase subunit 1 [Micromonosporaceae bacterium]|nr:allophanate hydrolase subunit 1 [Micromonosporaceae bacterium]